MQWQEGGNTTHESITLLARSSTILVYRIAFGNGAHLMIAMPHGRAILCGMIGVRTRADTYIDTGRFISLCCGGAEGSERKCCGY
jgi:hypothetical protein